MPSRIGYSCIRLNSSRRCRYHGNVWPAKQPCGERCAPWTRRYWSNGWRTGRRAWSPDADGGHRPNDLGETLQGQAVDGKALRGARAYGAALHLVSLVQHASGLVLAETAVAEKSNEITAVPRLLAGRDLAGTVTTMDALHTQTTTASRFSIKADTI